MVVFSDIILYFDLIPQSTIIFNNICNLALQDRLHTNLLIENIDTSRMRHYIIIEEISIIFVTFNLLIDYSGITLCGTQQLTNNNNNKDIIFQENFNFNTIRGFWGTEIMSEYIICDIYCFKIIKFQFLTKDYG